MAFSAALKSVIFLHVVLNDEPPLEEVEIYMQDSDTTMQGECRSMLTVTFCEFERKEDDEDDDDDDDDDEEEEVA